MARPEKIDLGALLVEQGWLDDAQLQAVREEQQRSGHRLARVIAAEGYASEEAVAKLLAQQMHIVFVDLNTFELKPELVKLLPEQIARRHRAIVLDSKGAPLLVGFSDPTDLTAYDEVAQHLQRDILLAAVVDNDLVPALNRIYTSAETVDAEAGKIVEEENEKTFDIYVTLPEPVEKEILTQRLIDNIGIEADKLESLVTSLTDRRRAQRIAKIRSDVSQKQVGKVVEDCKRAGLEVEVRECLQLEMIREEVPKEEAIPCPACGALIDPADKMKCPNCELVVNKDMHESDYILKKKIEEEERARANQANEKIRKSNEELLKEEQEKKLREEVRSELDIKKEQDLKAQRERELQKRLLKQRILLVSSFVVLILVLGFAAIRWLVPKPPQQQTAGRDAKAIAAQQAPIPEIKTMNMAGRIELAEGEVQVLDRNKQPKAIKPGDTINEGDSIVTGQNGELHIKMRDEGFIAVRPNTDMRLVAYRAQGDDMDGGVISLMRGSFRSVTGWIGKFNAYAYQVKTPTATIGIRGTDHEPLVIPPGSKDGEPGTYDKVNIGSSYIETPQGRVDVPAGKAGFSPNLPQAEKMVPRLLSEVPPAFKPTQNEKLIEPRHAEVQQIVEKQREEQRKNAEQYCRK